MEQGFFNQPQFKFSVRRDITSTPIQVEEKEEVNNENEQLFEEDLTNQEELTKNDEYRVLKLKSTPDILYNKFYNQGDVDQITKHACITNNKSIEIWNYLSNEKIPNTFKFKIDNPQNSLIPVLVLPPPGIDEPGLVIINKLSGEIRYYEYISNDSSINMLYKKENITLNVSLHGGEKITLVKNIEPMGVIFATNQGRLILISLKDFSGKPKLKQINIISSSFLPFLKTKNEIVSINAGKDLGHGTRSISILTNNGSYAIYNISTDGQVIKLFETCIFDQLLSEIKDLYENDNIKILDFYSLNDDNNILVLSSVKVNNNESCYILFDFKKSGDELLMNSAYRLINYTKPYDEKVFIPKLLLPNPKNTAFIIFQDGIILIENSFENFNFDKSRKWEDVVLLKSGTNILSVGIEDYSNPSVILITNNSGILKIEKFIKGEEDSKSSFTKSHIEQAVFYGYSNDSINPLSFNIPTNINIEESEIENAIIDVSNELIESKSIYLPPKLSLLENHLELRFSKLKNLAQYIAKNFLGEISIDAKIKVLNDLEKINGACNVWKILKPISNEEIFLKIGKLFTNDDNLETFFYHHIDDLSSFLSKILDELINSNSSMNYLIAVNLIINGVKDGSIAIDGDIRKSFSINNDESSNIIPWYIENDLIFRYQEIFEKFYQSNDQDETKDISNQLVNLVSILFFTFNQALSYYSNLSITKTSKEILQKIQMIYETNSNNWIDSLIKFDEIDAALKLSEKFENLMSIIRIFGNQRDEYIKHNLNDEIILKQIDGYLEKFGYKFAENLFNYYLFKGDLNSLLMGFPNYNHYLKRFLNSKNHDGISWIRYLIDEDYLKASNTLYENYLNNDNLISNKKLQLSIAKLSLFTEDEVDETFLKQIENGLIIIEIQEYLYDEIAQFITNNDNVEDTFKLFTTTLIENSQNELSSNLKISFKRLLTKKSLPVKELILLLILLDLKTEKMKLNFFLALKLLSLELLTFQEKKIFEVLTWRKIILIDDFQFIKNSNKTNDYLNEKIEKTLIYSTLLNCFKEKLFKNLKLPELNYLINEEIFIEELNKIFKINNQKKLVLLNDEFIKNDLNKIEKKISLFDLDNFLKILIATANENSGMNDLINYKTLKLA